jgi:DNA-binding winged helix-turn-helix (wHTH) protein
MAAVMHDFSAECVSFGPFQLLPKARVLYRGGVPVALGSRALDILIALVEEAGQVVSQRKLIARAWRGLVVESGNLRVQMANLRRGLGDGVQGIRYIANVPGQGYCFVAPVQRLDSNEWPVRSMHSSSRRRIVQEQAEGLSG